MNEAYGKISTGKQQYKEGALHLLSASMSSASAEVPQGGEGRGACQCELAQNARVRLCHLKGDSVCFSTCVKDGGWELWAGEKEGELRHLIRGFRVSS